MAAKVNEKTSLNLPANMIEAACYVPWVGWIFAIIVLLLEKNSELRWHAVHGFILAFAIMILAFVLGMTIILAPLVMIVWVGGIIAQVYMAVKVYNGEKPRLWKVSEWADKAAEKVKM